MKTFILSMTMAILTFVSVNAQVKIGNNPNTINSNSILELESTNKGFLPPRIALNSLESIAPLTDTVPAGMLVYSFGGSVIDGYYYWSGTEWKKLANGVNNLVTKTTNTTLTKTETIVLASNDITLTLPVVTAADNGLEITVKNIGTHTDLVTVVGSSPATIDGIGSTELTRYIGQTLVATGGNWIIKGVKSPDHILDVDENGSWTTIQEVVDFLNLHMTAPAIVRLADVEFNITSTIIINLPYSVTFQGLSFGQTTIAAASGLVNKPMFRCFTDCYFKMIQFEATTLASYGTLSGEDGIRLLGSGTYSEIKDCTFHGFYNTILDSTDAELWLFECDISNSHSNGLLIHGNVAGVKVRVAETDFIDCVRGINLSKATQANFQLSSAVFMNANATDTAIVYRPSTYTTFTIISITGNAWNNVGKYIEGFDFTRSDSRDANAVLEANAGMADQKPNCFINVLNSNTTKTLTNQNTWYKADWGTNTSEQTCKLGITNNKITYQPINKRNGIFTVTGNLSVNSNSQNLSIGIVKNGVSTTRYGETTLRVVTTDQPFQFSFIALIENIQAGDYFEVYYSNATSSGKAVKVQDIQWVFETR